MISKVNKDTDTVNIRTYSVSNSVSTSRNNSSVNISSNDHAELVSLPNESTHAYTYNPLSPNSLTVRLNILKRSLQVLINNPDMLGIPKKRKNGEHASTASRSDSNVNHKRNFTDTPLISNNHTKTQQNLQLNTHSAAINAFVTNSSNSTIISRSNMLKRPQPVQRTISLMLLPENHDIDQSDLEEEDDDLFKRPRASFYLNDRESSSAELINEQISYLLELLDFLNQTLDDDNSNSPQKATDLHKLSLVNINKLFTNVRDAESNLQMKKSLLNSLAEPFVQLNTNNKNNLDEINPHRIINNFTSSKNSPEKAIFTCSQDYPWHFKSANDLTCLNFNISRKTLKILTLLDLIHPDSRDFIISKLTSIYDKGNKNNDLIFAGEIVPIINGNSLHSWASLWIKKRNDLLVCVFEKVPCDFMDIVLKLNEEDSLMIDKVTDVSNLLSLNGEFESEGEKKELDIACISKSLNCLITDSNPSDITNISRQINNTRYFTLNYSNYNIPCAIASSILNDNNLKLKIHSLPYQAGLFLVDASNFKLISFNKSISKNLFGYHSVELINEPITTIIPNFIDMLKFINENKKQSTSQVGLVLTEHYFRKIQSEMNNDPDEFYTSTGIDVLHKDGATIKIDIQLRTINTNIIALWLTHSRDVLFNDYSIIPSQMQKIDSTDKIDELQDLLDTVTITPSTLPTSQSTIKSIVDYASTTPRTEDTICEERTATQQPNTDEIDPKVKAKVELTKLYTSDKSKFVTSDNFKVDEKLIAGITSNPLSQPEPPTLPNGINPFGIERRTKRMADFVVLQKLGDGAYGHVHLCMNKKTKHLVIIKAIIKERILIDTWVRDREFGTIPSEIYIMSKFNAHPHDNITQIMDFFEDDDYYYIELESHGETGSIDLFDLIELKTNMTEFEAKLIFKQIVSGIKYLHDQGIVHRDIKDENVIVDSNGFVKLIDFGSAAYTKTGPFEVFVGTIDYAAPEILGGNPYKGKPQDIWALGVLLYTLIYKENPFYNVDEILEGQLRFDGTCNVTQDCIDLIRWILTKSVNDRPSIDEIVNSEWLQI
ncbi:hypothetical protein KAFR_0D01220 [Kazachstania africana CBS 2517]|uniref:non-specific serine/threonine protein kinase n=1 Tax=Kazachstania africana (strain ATCC 22294 / BCRC 22015 / CBS 2517 / CECT 1963 / NBRC 1671 / NRRL Y-8276) TaxID=1071382 RepID=H2ATR8_KAZAF|nr:hypothetical protein KAFR_0D01220 [Kazachstania africana CBS 2517]CCF57768.1 hypothetical protein KAFR_0D01220 [Kazachstania africana CBS 2517]